MVSFACGVSVDSVVSFTPVFSVTTGISFCGCSVELFFMLCHMPVTIIPPTKARIMRTEDSAFSLFDLSAMA